jgi:hypothetical protein
LTRLRIMIDVAGKPGARPNPSTPRSLDRDPVVREVVWITIIARHPVVLTRACPGDIAIGDTGDISIGDLKNAVALTLFC